MRDNKISLLLLASFLLLLASFLVLCTWGYNFYTKVEKASAKLTPYTVPVKEDDGKNRDSLINLYTQTIQRFDEKLSGTWTNADSLEKDLQFKLDEYYRVKNELATILKNPATAINNELARNKIAELQQKIRLLQNTNVSVTEENKRLNALLEQMKNESRTATASNSIISQGNSSTPFAQTARFAEQKITEQPSGFTVFDLDLNYNPDAKDGDDLAAITGSFIVKSNFSNSGELMMVVVQPNGKVLQKSAWESGTFNCHEGKKIYSCKLYLENTKGESKRLSFSINTDKITKGNYIFQIYHNGQSLGKITKNIS